MDTFWHVSYKVENQETDNRMIDLENSYHNLDVQPNKMIAWAVLNNPLKPRR